VSGSGPSKDRNRLDFATFLVPNVAAAVSGRAGERGAPMTELEFQAKLAELDRLLNDPEVRMDPNRVWTLLAEISAQELRQATR
jgi:hypothetical protein